MKGESAARHPIVDAHLHVFSMNVVRYPMAANAPYEPEPAPVEQLLITMGMSGVDVAVAVQPQPYRWDNSYLSDCLEAHPDRLIGICLADPRSPEGPAELRRLCAGGRFQGFRLNVGPDDDGAWLADGTVDPLWSVASEMNLVVCVQMTPRHAPHLRAQAARFPGVRFVVDHLGLPDVGEPPPYQRFQNVLRLAELPTAHVKLSALFAFSKQGFPYVDTLPFVELAHKEFEASRMLWGTDFPNVLQECGYQAALDHVRGEIPFLTEVDREWILGRTAASLWRLPKGKAPDLNE